MVDLWETYCRQAKAFRLKIQEEHETSLKESRKLLTQDPRRPSLYIRLAESHEALKQHAASLDVLSEGIKRCVPSIKLHQAYIHELAKLNRTAEAIAAARRALRTFPNDLRIRIKEALLLPILYRSAGEMSYYRQRFTRGLENLIGGLSLQTPAACRQALEAVAGHVNFYLSYQGCDDLQLQEKYGKFVHRIVTANFPDWARAVPMPGLDNRVRVGYVSAFFRNHSVSKTHLGWLREHNGSEFDVYAYYLGEKMDAVTAELHGCTKRFQHSLNSITDVCRAIRSDNLHVLVFLDLGMKPVMTQAASLRLAPIQCSTWGHPVTSGLPTVDYFLSSALMEPRNAHCHYTERLVTLPGVGICYRKPIIPKVLLRKSRHDYGLRTDAIVYLSCQSLFKYLPEDDGIFPAIAKQIPEAQFVFLTPNDYLLRDFRWRLERAFSAVGLSVRDHCVFLPEQDTFSYWNLNLLADVYLDTMQWSGCNTTLEALACGLPVVTLPGKFMRGRHSYAILTQLRVTDTIAHDKADYIDIAARLGRNPEWRVFLAQRVNDGYFRLYSDVSSVSALEEFYKQMVKENRTVVEANTPAAV